MFSETHTVSRMHAFLACSPVLILSTVENSITGQRPAKGVVCSCIFSMQYFQLVRFFTLEYLLAESFEILLLFVIVTLVFYRLLVMFCSIPSSHWSKVFYFSQNCKSVRYYFISIFAQLKYTGSLAVSLESDRGL